MGACLSSKGSEDPAEAQRIKDTKIRDTWISDMMVKDADGEREVIKLLFLGAGESGKSTLMKQMTILHGAGFPAEERLHFVPLIRQNILQSAQVLARQSVIKGRQDSCFSVEEGNAEHRNRVLDIKRFDDEDPLTPDVVVSIKQLWADNGIQAVFEASASFQLSESTEYFMGRLDEVVGQGYVPTKQDILRARIRTTGIVEHRFIIQDNLFAMFDVGGQRNARRKWLHCFENVASVIFVAALSGYNQVLYEDKRVNRMHEALNLFSDICNSHFFRRTSIILFLNKKDAAKKKIAVKKIPLTVCFPEYDGENTYRAMCRYVKEKFKQRNAQTSKRIYTHFTCATDTDNVQRVFASVQHIILRSHLMEIGLIDRNTDLTEADDGDADADADLQ